MKKITILLLLAFTGVEVYSQDSLIVPEIKYRSKIFEASIYGHAKKESKGYLVQVTDSTIALSAKPKAFHITDLSKDSLMRIGFSEISSIRVKKQNSAGKGALIGFLIGATIGTVAGASMSSGHSDDGGIGVISS